MKSINLDGHDIAVGKRCFIIAEAGVNHNGDLALARRLVREAKTCGADCVKFQTFKAERVVTLAAPKAAYQLKVTDPAESQLAMLRKLELSAEAHRDLLRLCQDEDILFLSTPYSVEDAEFLDSLGVAAFKIASGQLTEIPLLVRLVEFNKPMILSTGMATLAEIKEAVEVLTSHGARDLVLLQCTTNYPSRLEDANLRAMGTIREETGMMTGYSDHTEGITACLAAVALGAVVVEKHFTLDHTLPGPDHLCSSDPGEFRALVQGIRDVESALGDRAKCPTAAEMANLIGMRRSIVAKHLIPAGRRVVGADFAFKRPATGLAPKRLGELVGRVARHDIAADTQVQLEHFL